jgi:hypothetical protein
MINNCQRDVFVFCSSFIVPRSSLAGDMLEVAAGSETRDYPND